MREWRQVDVPAVAGYVASWVGFAVLVGALPVRAWWRFATSGVELLVVVGWLGLSGCLSWWAYTTLTWAEGGWKALVFFGVAPSTQIAGRNAYVLVVDLHNNEFSILPTPEGTHTAPTIVCPVGLQP